MYPWNKMEVVDLLFRGVVNNIPPPPEYLVRPLNISNRFGYIFRPPPPPPEYLVSPRNISSL